MDPPMFGTTLLEEYRRARDILGVDDVTLRRLAARSIEASFAPPHANASGSPGDQRGDCGADRTLVWSAPQSP
jgi:hypothetical protein